jgi:thiamine transport system permease protein
MTQQRSVDRIALPVGTVVTLAVLVVVFYYPVGSVLAAAAGGDGVPTLAPVLDVLSDPFYTGVAHHLFTDPLGVASGVLAWIEAGAPGVSFGLFGFTTYQAFLSTVASVALGLPAAYVLSRYEF